MSATALVVGEALVDIVTGPIDTAVLPGGSPMNVAIGLQRLGVRSVFHSQFGRDEYGRVLASHLESNGVETTSSSVDDQPTSRAIATIGADGGAEYDFSVTWSPAPEAMPRGRFDVVHAGSIGALLDPGASAVEALIGRMRSTSTICFDPNIRPAVVGRRDHAVERVERFVAMSDVVKASDEDIAWLYPNESQSSVMGRWSTMGPALVVVTKGAAGAVSVTQAGIVYVPAPSVVVTDTIGAGDSFMAGVIAGVTELGLTGSAQRTHLTEIGPRAHEQVIQFAVACAAISTQREGANPPLRNELSAEWFSSAE